MVPAAARERSSVNIRVNDFRVARSLTQQTTILFRGEAVTSAPN